MTAEIGGADAPIRRTTSLVINVSTLLQEPIGALRRYEVDARGGAGLESDVSGSLRLLRTDQSVLATAAMRTSVVDACGGCLAPVELELSLTFDEEFWPAVDAWSGVAVEPPAERVGFAVVDGQIDLSEAVRQYVEMERPMSPRCAADCPGLETDSTNDAPIDARWAALAALQMESEGD